MEKIWTKDKALKFLRENPLASIAVNGQDYPISSLVLFYTDEDFNFYFGTGKESFKAQALLKNPKLSFSVWKSELALAQGTGLAAEITDPTELDARMDDIVKETRNLPHFWPPLLGIWKHGYILFKVKINLLRMLDLSEEHIKEPVPKFTEFKF